MGYVWSQEISKEVTLVGSDGECSMHMNGLPERIEETPIIDLTNEQWQMMLGLWLSEMEAANYDGSRQYLLNDIPIYTRRVSQLEQLLIDAQFLLEEAAKIATDIDATDDLKQLQDWQAQYKNLHP